MARKDTEVAKLAPSFMTGGGGENFERHVAAVFVLSLIVEGLSPIIDAPIKELKFQAKNSGYDVDDLVVTAVQGDDLKKLLCQVKHDVAITTKNTTFQEVITAAWSDFNKPSFNRKTDLIALITGFIAKDSIEALRYLHEQAYACKCAEDFRMIINQSKFTSNHCKERYETIKGCIKKANNDVEASDKDIWEFFKCFVLGIFDLDYERSINQSMVRSLIKCKTDHDAKLIWSRIADKCGYWKQSAATITKDSIPEDLLELFDMVPTAEDTKPLVLPDTISLTNSLSIVALIGAWDEKNKNDIEAIEQLTGCAYSLFQRECREYLKSGIINLQNGVWKVINRAALMNLVSELYFDNTIQTSFYIARKYLKETSRQFSEDGIYSLVIPSTGRFSNSDIFRKSLLEGLCVLSNGVKPLYASDHIIEAESSRLVAEVLEDCDWIRLVSLADFVVLLGEMNPSVYLNSLEKLIHNMPDEVLRLFPKNNELFPNQNFISNILFSLERLAWHEDYLVQSVTCLSALESLKYEKTNWTNTPINSMISILNPYIVQTFASLEKIKSAVQAIKLDYADICWNFCCKMLSKRCINGMTKNIQPKYLLKNRTCGSKLSKQECQDLRKYYVQQTLFLVGTSSARIKIIINSLFDLQSEEYVEVLKMIRSASILWDDNEKSDLWIRLLDLQYREISNNDGQEPVTAEFKDLCTTIDEICPQSILLRYKRFFIFPYGDYSNAANRWEKNEQQKQNAVVEIYREHGLDALIEFSKNLGAEYDIGYRLGREINATDMSNILSMCKKYEHKIFYENMVQAFFKKNGMCILKEMEISLEDSELMLFIFKNVPFTQELLDLIPVYLQGNEEKFWKTVCILPYSFRHEDFDVISVSKILMQHHRTCTAIMLLGMAVHELRPDSQLIYNMLLQAPNEQTDEELDPDSTKALIEYLQNSTDIEIERLSQIEFIYLIWLDEYSDVKPKAIEFMLSNDPNCFCDLMSLAYKKRHDSHKHENISKAIRDRVFQLTFQYNIIPGMDWNGNFHSDVFEEWMRYVVEWSKGNDRFEVSMHTIGSALSYAKFNEDGLIEPIMMEELNKVESDDLRSGYRMAIPGQRGVHSVDPEGKPEKDLAQIYQFRANSVENLGYSRFARLLRDIAADFLREADENSKRFAIDEENS